MRKSLLFLMLVIISTNIYAKSGFEMPNVLESANEKDYINIESKYTTSKNRQVILFKMFANKKALYIDAPIDSELVEIVSNLLRFEKIEYVYLNSFGGMVNDGIDLGMLFRTNNITTVIDRNKDCHSSCFISYLGGVKRLIHTSGVSSIRLTSHTPFILNGTIKEYASLESDFGRKVCDYIERVSNNGKRICFDMFSAKGEATYSISKLKNVGIVTDFMAYHIQSQIAEFEVPKDKKSQWFSSCFKAKKDFSSSYGACDAQYQPCMLQWYQDYSWPEYQKCIEPYGIPYSEGSFIGTPSGWVEIKLKKKLEIVGHIF
ncbi:hypothetical protein H4J56_13865 [Colwellia sp. BRX8-4]|nr:hypothetical protein [Colwellia sp. BRX8-4]